MRDPLALQQAMRSIAERRIRAAIELGAFDNLPGEGRPIPGLEQPYDPDWWIKKWLERMRSEEPVAADDAALSKVAAGEELRRPPLARRQRRS